MKLNTNYIMKMNYTLVLSAVAGSLLIASPTLRASETDDRIESAARKSYVFKNYLKADSITTESKEGVVTLTGTVLVASHKSLAENNVSFPSSRASRTKSPAIATADPCLSLVPSDLRATSLNEPSSCCENTYRSFAAQITSRD